MTKSIFSLLLAGAMFLWCCNIEISFSPFRVRLPGLLQGIGWMLLIIGMSLISVYHQRKGDKAGYIRGLTDYDSAVKKLNEKQANK